SRTTFTTSARSATPRPRFSRRSNFTGAIERSPISNLQFAFFNLQFLIGSFVPRTNPNEDPFMSKRVFLAVVAAGLAWATMTSAAAAFEGAVRRWDPGNRNVTWHAEWYDPAWGQPVALVVPPTAGTHTEYSWGVSGSRTVPILNQFQRGY